MKVVFHASDIAVLPSRHEGFGLVAVEAMASGVPVIRSDTGGCSDQIDEGKNGFSVPINDATALADKLRLMLSQDIRRKMGMSASETSKRFDKLEMAEQTVEIYESVTVSPKSSQ